LFSTEEIGEVSVVTGRHVIASVNQTSFVVNRKPLSIEKVGRAAGQWVEPI
jgi:hypothetical protein